MKALRPKKTPAQVRYAAFNAAKEIADALDGTDFRLGIQELFQRQACAFLALHCNAKSCTGKLLARCIKEQMESYRRILTAAGVQPE